MDKFRKHVVIVIIAALFFALGYFIYLKSNQGAILQEKPHPVEDPGVANNTIDPVDALARFNADYSSKIDLRPANGNWFLTDVAQISPVNAVIRFEDGHDSHVAVIDMQSKNILGLEQSRGDFTDLEWQSLTGPFDAEGFTARYYTLSLVRGGEVVSFDRLTPVAENIFLRSGTPGVNIDTTNIVTFTDRGYQPKTLTVKKGTTVTWKSNSDFEMWPASANHPTHAVYPTTGGCLGSTFDACRKIAPGGSWSFEFDVAGNWNYHDHLNPSFTGTIVVAP